MREFPVVFHFKVEFDPLEAGGSSADDEDVRFQEVTGIAGEISTEEVREGGLNEYIHRIPTGAKYGNLVLKRGFVVGTKLTDWFRKAIENFDFEPRDATVTLLNEQSEPLAAWRFLNAYPIKWSISDLKSQENAIVIESMEMAYRMFRKV